MSKKTPGDEWQERVLERLLSLKREGESDAAFSRRLGLQPQHLSNYRSGRHGLSLQTAVRIARHTGLSLDWLLRGEGAPFPSGAEAPGADAEGPSAEEAARDLKRFTDALRLRLDELRGGGRIADEEVDRFERTLDEVVEPLLT